jgi:flagellar hook assembly protein FlgD
MRYGILIALALAGLLTGATCLPLIDLDEDETVVSGTTLAVAVTRPSADRAVPPATRIEIEWMAANLTSSEAVATVLVRFRDDRSETILAGGLRLPAGQTTGTLGWDTSLDWDTSDFLGGAYSIVARIEADGQTKEATAPGRITINTPPSFEFTEPTEDTELIGQVDPNDPNAPPGPASVTIRWTAFDPDGDGTAQIRIDPEDPNLPDEPDTDRDSGDEITIAEVSIPSTAGFDSLEWDGTDSAGERVPGATYDLFAVVSDGVNDEQIIEASVQIVVPDEIELALTEPSENETLLTSDPNDVIMIEFTLDEDNDVFIDLRIDPDDNHRNGNETTIVARRKIEQGTKEGSEEWRGQDSEGNDVGDGIYRLIMVVNRSSGPSETVRAEGLVFVRSSENQPLIALLEPNTDATFTGGEGGELLIRWRDDDPSDSATIRLTIDDDATPNEGGAETDGAEENIPSADDLDPSGDGLDDTFTYYVSDDRPPGRYWIFAYIDRADEAGIDHIAIAGGQLVIEDPDEPGGG